MSDIKFEEIKPNIDNGKSTRLKIDGNFAQIKAWLDGFSNLDDLFEKVNLGTVDAPAYAIHAKYSLGIGKDLTVDGKATIKELDATDATITDLRANTGTFGGILKAAAVTVIGALTAATVSANVFNGDLNGNAATATRLQTMHKLWGNDFNGTGDINGNLSLGTADILGYNNARIIQNLYGDLGLNPLNNVGINTTSPAYKLDVNGNVRIISDLYADATVGTRNYFGKTVGWRVDNQGNADFRTIYSDELNVLAFTAQVSQALAGSDYLTRSVSKLSVNFNIPNAVGQTAMLIVDDLEGFPGIQCFANGDYVRLRPINRNGGLIVGNVYGTVALDTSFGVNGFSNGTQAYIFTAKSIINGAGLIVYKGAEILDYGTSGSGLIRRTTLDAAGSPYMDIDTWANDPSVGSNLTTHVRLGNLGGIASCSGYGIYSDNAFFTRSIVIGDLTKTANYLSFDNVNGLQIKLGGYSVATTADTSNAYNSAVSYTNSQVSVLNNSISAKVSQVDFNALGQRVTTAETNISANSNSISAQATNISNLNGRISTAEAKITPDAINLTVKSQVDTSYNNAVNAASTDATTKANAAYSNAVSYTNSQIIATNNSITAAVNAIEIGGRNLARLSKGNFTYSLQDIANYTGSMCVAYWVENKSTNIVVSGDVEYSNIVFTGTGSHNLAIQGAQDIGGWGEGLGFGLYNKISEGNGKFHFSFATSQSSILNNNRWYFGFRSDYITGTITFKNLSVVYGNKEITWSPAPEDVDASISTAQSSAISTAASNAAALYVTQSAYSAQVSILQNSINAKVSQTDFNSLGSRVSTAESNITQNANNIASKVSASDYTGNTIASLINQTATTIAINASKINLTGAVTFSTFSSDLQNTINGKATTSYVDSNVNTCLNKASAAQSTANNAQSAAQTAQGTANDAVNRNNTVAVKLGFSSFDALQNESALTQTIITGGKIRTTILDVVAIVTQGLSAQSINANNATISNLNVTNANVSGKLNGVVGTFSEIKGDNGTCSMGLLPELLAFNGPTSQALIGVDTVPATLGGIVSSVAYIHNYRSASSYQGNFGIELNVTGAVACNDDANSPYLGNYALWIDKGRIAGVRWKVRRVTKSSTLSVMDVVIISCANSGDITITMPSSCEDGQFFMMRKAAGSNIYLNSNNSADRFMWQGRWNGDISTGGWIEGGALVFLVYDLYNHIWYVHGGW